MARQDAFDSASLAPSRYTEQHAPQFTGGETDPGTGNILPATRAQISGDNPPPPAKPSTQLGAIEAAPPDHRTTDAILSGVGQAAVGAGAKAIGNSFSSKGDSTNPLDRGTGREVSPMTGTPSSSSSGGGSNWADQPWLAPSGAPTSSTTGDFAPGNTSFGYSGSAAPSAPSAGDYSATHDVNGHAYSDSYGGGGGDFLGGDSGGGGDYGGGDDGGGGDGGTVICTELHRQGFMDDATYAADRKFGVLLRAHHPLVYIGYRMWADHIVRGMKRSRRFSVVVNGFAAPWAAYMAVRMGRNGLPPLRGIVFHHVGFVMCLTLGAIKSRQAQPAAQRA